MTSLPSICVYGHPSPELAMVPTGAAQVSPLFPGSLRVEEIPTGSVARFIMAAPPGTVERRYAIAQALRVLEPGGALTVMAPKDKGGARLGKELAGFGGQVEETGRRHQRICNLTRTPGITGLEAAIAAGAPQWIEAMGLWSQPGLFSWDRPDPGTVQLLSVLPPMGGVGADLGCGTGVIARAVLSHPAVSRLHLIDNDRRALDAAQRNVVDIRADFHWSDVRIAPALEGLDFVVMNPPFHDGGAEDRTLGQAFVRKAHGMLRKGGMLWLVANRHLPYEAVLNEQFAAVQLRGETGGFKVYEARR